MKMNPLVGELSLYDVVGTPGVGADLSHIDTAPKVSRPTSRLYTYAQIALAYRARMDQTSTYCS